MRITPFVPSFGNDLRVGCVLIWVHQEPDTKRGKVRGSYQGARQTRRGETRGRRAGLRLSAGRRAGAVLGGTAPAAVKKEQGHPGSTWTVLRSADRSGYSGLGDSELSLVLPLRGCRSPTRGLTANLLLHRSAQEESWRLDGNESTQSILLRADPSWRQTLPSCHPGACPKPGRMQARCLTENKDRQPSRLRS